ncbi:glycosyltransferase family 2 protein [Caenispirillum salinarum]|uniref:glycosyltransferase family 2 protein n=1 Tax=Caenispirillum salinarum TaxID=859058 RepID=UPI00384B552E
MPAPAASSRPAPPTDAVPAFPAEPTVSVIIPCYNAETWLAQTIGSVLDQTRPPDEVIVVDDGSPDGSLALARRFEERGAVRVLALENGGAARARNLGALAATGDALMFLDADDVLAPDALEHLLTALQKAAASRSGGDAIAACPWERLHLSGDGRWISGPPTCATRLPGADVLASWLTGWYYPPCCVLWSRAAFQRTGGWDEALLSNQDGDLMMRALALGIPLAETPHGRAFYRRLPDAGASLSGKRLGAPQTRSRLAVGKKLAAWMTDHDGMTAYRPALRRYFNMIGDAIAGIHPDLEAEARALAKRHGPTPPAHVQAVLRNKLAQRRLRQVGNHDAAPRREVRAGLDKAAALLAAPAWPDPPPALLARRPAVSVVVPTFNRPDLLTRCLTSIVSQDVSDMEVLVVDDGQSAATAAAVAAFGDARLRYLRQPENGGPARARNRGMAEARGAFIAFLDDDDEWLPGKVSRQLTAFEAAGRSVALVHGGLEKVGPTGAAIPERATAHGSAWRDMLLRNVVPGGGTVMIRREVLSDIGFFDTRFPAIEDYDYWLRVCLRHDIDCIDAPLMRYYDDRALGDGGQVTRVSRNQARDRAARALFFEKHASVMREAGVAHRFLLTLVDRHMEGPVKDFAGARRWALRAAAEAPLDADVRSVLARLYAPPGAGRVLRAVKRAMGTRATAGGG